LKATLSNGIFPNFALARSISFNNSFLVALLSSTSPLPSEPLSPSEKPQTGQGERVASLDSCAVLSLLCDAVPDADDVLGDKANGVRAEGLVVGWGAWGEVVTAAGLVTGSAVLGFGVDGFCEVGIFKVV
jgi:hypothetical protein